jgi:hypothetical protein
MSDMAEMTHALRPPRPHATPAPLTPTPARSMLVQRRCACGGAPGPDGECAACKARRLSAQRQAAPPAAQPPLAASRTGATAAVGHDFGRLPVQARLTIGAANDRYEQEADRVAEIVTRMPDPQSGQGAATPARPVAGAIMPLIQRQAEGEEAASAPAGSEEEEGFEPTPERLRELEESNAEPLVQSKRAAGAAASTGPGPAPVRQALGQRQQGQTLDPATRTFMESRFGYDFAQVRLHANEQAHQAARSIGARAFTSGQDIWFARGELAPETPAGSHLLAHELAHTVQQRGQPAGLHPLVQRAFCPSACESVASRGRLCRASSVTRDGCGERDAEDDSNKISHIRVQLDRRKVHLFWNGSPDTDQGTKEEIDCTPWDDPQGTPRGRDVVGNKCGVNHTSYQRYNMAWFTAFKNTGMVVGFHDSQPLGSAYHSHGCVRVSCENAEKINKNTKSNWTSIRVRDSLPGD